MLITTRPAKTTTGPAMSRVASCYNPGNPPGACRQLDIRRDNRLGSFICATLSRGEVIAVKYRHSEAAALEYAADLGYTDVIREDREP